MNVKFLRGSALPTEGIIDGAFYALEGNNGVTHLYLGKTINGTAQAIPITSPVVDLSGELDPAVAALELPVGTLVWGGDAGEISKLSIVAWNDTTGEKYLVTLSDDYLTNATVTGTGNAITGASVVGGELTLTKGETFATKTQLDTIEANQGGHVYTKTSESTDIDELSAGISGKPGDVLIVKNSNGVASAYMFDRTTSKWVACTGNVDAAAVILKDNITLAGNYTQVGNLTKTQSGTATFSTAGKSVEAALTEIFSKKLQPSKTEPSVSITFSGAKAYEVGTKITPSYSATLNAGSYTYGPATGITAKTWEVTDTDSHTLATATGSFAELTVGDATNYKITAKATYDAGAVAKDNLGGTSDPVVQIAAGNKSATSGSVTGYRSFFYGVVDNTDALTSTIIRGLTNGGAYNGSKTFTINATATAKRIVIAVPSSSNRAGLSSVILTSAMNTPVTDSYVKTAKAAKVEGVGGYTSVDYDVWVYQPAAIDAGEVHKVTLA
mgnify:CR=1 FL=1